MMMILVTGGAGFIGSNFVYEWMANEAASVVNVDKLTYAGTRHNLSRLEGNSRHIFIQGDILDKKQLQEVLERYRPKSVVNFAAETHVDRSIHEPEIFVKTNVTGTFHLLEACLRYWEQLEDREKKSFRFLHMSTDEVYGSLTPSEASSKEASLYAPNSPYAASKASADHFVRAFYQTYGLPTLVVHSSNAYGPYQFPEKLIPLVIVNAIHGKPIPLYGDGMNIRSWIYVIDLCSAIRDVLHSGAVGEAYNISDNVEKTNKDTVEMVCSILNELQPNLSHRPYASLIQYIKDRPGHDRRYSIDSSKIRKQLGWKPKNDFQSNMRQTIEWYLSHAEWLEKVMDSSYQDWIHTHYTEN